MIAPEPTLRLSPAPLPARTSITPAVVDVFSTTSELTVWPVPVRVRLFADE